MSRSGADESVHHGVVVALDATGAIAWQAGDADVGVFARSAVKPSQAAAMLAGGLDLPDAQLALVCASHSGTTEHLDGVRAILAGAGLTEGDLDNTPGRPIDDDAADAVVRAGDGPAAIFQNCSGKHAGMLATCVVNGWPTAGYRDADHPVQRLILEHVGRATGGVHHVGVDGCGAPAPVVSLVGLARAVRELACTRHAAYRAMTSHPDLVGGPGRDVTRLMAAVPGLLAKDGAEGVYVAALPDGRAVALKVADGASRARLPVMVAALRSLGVDVPSGSLVEPILGHGRPVGEVRAVIGAS